MNVLTGLVTSAWHKYWGGDDVKFFPRTKNNRAGTQIAGPERFDVMPLLVTSDGAIAALGVDHRRLRPNLVVGGVPGLAERAWERRFLAVGEAVIGLKDLRARCIMTTFDPDTGAQDLAVLAGIRGMLAPGGSLLVIDEKTGERFTAPANPAERLFYGYSVMSCLPEAMTDRPTAGTGTVMRPDTLRRYAREAGYREVEVLDLGLDLMRGYRLIP